MGDRAGETVFVTQLNSLLSASDGGIILYGAGANAVRLLIRLKYGNYRVPVHCIADADPAKQGTTLLGISIVHPQSLTQYDRQTRVCVTPDSYYLAIADTLNGMGFHNLFFYNSWGAQVLTEGKTTIQGCLANRAALDRLLAENAAVAKTARACLQDEKSKAVFDARIRSTYHGEHLALERLCEGEQYFPQDIVHLTGNEVFVDCGAFDGGTILDFRRRAGEYDYIYSFEPDPLQYELTKAVVAAEKVGKCDVYNLAVSDGDGLLLFSSRNLGSSRLDATGDSTVRAVSLDALLFAKPHHPTFLKMDIEGAELDALKGAREVILRDHPQLAISVYHGKTHLFEIPHFIKTNFPEYRIFLRQHANLNETVCYAV